MPLGAGNFGPSIRAYVLCTGLFGFSAQAQPPPICTPPPSSMVGWWLGDGNANDIVGHDNGTLSGGVTFPSGVVGQAFNFNGSDGIVVAPNTQAIDLVRDLTIEAWINPTSNARGYIVVKGDGNDYVNAYSFRYGLADDQRLLLSVADGSTGSQASYFVSATGVVPVGVFSHVAVVIQGTTAALYVNGGQVAGYYGAGQGIGPVPGSATQLTANRFSDHGSLKIGNGNGIPFNGLIDEVSVYNRALSISEIQAIYNAGSAGKCKGCQAHPTLGGMVAVPFHGSVSGIQYDGVQYHVELQPDTCNWAGRITELVIPITNNCPINFPRAKVTSTAIDQNDPVSNFTWSFHDTHAFSTGIVSSCAETSIQYLWWQPPGGTLIEITPPGHPLTIDSFLTINTTTSTFTDCYGNFPCQSVSYRK